MLAARVTNAPQALQDLQRALAAWAASAEQAGPAPAAFLIDLARWRALVTTALEQESWQVPMPSPADPSGSATDLRQAVAAARRACAAAPEIAAAMVGAEAATDILRVVSAAAQRRAEGVASDAALLQIAIDEAAHRGLVDLRLLLLPALAARRRGAAGATAWAHACGMISPPMLRVLVSLVDLAGLVRAIEPEDPDLATAMVHLAAL